ncbi:hypothetical protein HFO27_37300 [Rhizobium leguminosarum]|nr:hypothetical protein [Rhizobium leguminosarum]
MNFDFIADMGILLSKPRRQFSYFKTRHDRQINLVGGGCNFSQPREQGLQSRSFTQLQLLGC